MSCCERCETGHACESGRFPQQEQVHLSPEVPDLQVDDDAGLRAPLSLTCGRPVAVNALLAVSHQQPNVSEALLLGACVAGSVDVIVTKLNNITSVEATLEGGLDRRNWKPISSTILTSEGYGRFRFRGQSYRFIRIWYSASGSPGGVVILSTTVNPSKAASA